MRSRSAKRATGSGPGALRSGEPAAELMAGAGQAAGKVGSPGSTSHHLTGNALANHLAGNSDNNVLDGRGGADRMAGGGGNDTYIVDNVHDRVTEKAKGGIDTVRSSVSFSLAGQAIENLTLTGGKSLHAGGNALANHLTGNSGNNVLIGHGGADRMAGGRGNDTYVVDNIHDRVIEKAKGGIDTVKSSVSFSLAGQAIENLVLTGGKAIHATGNALANHLTGNSGDNVIEGGRGVDTLKGGGGADTFVFHAGDGFDTITDFVVSGKNAGVIRLDHPDFETFDAVMATAREVDGNLVLYLDGKTRITLKGVTQPLTAANFEFAKPTSGAALTGSGNGGKHQDTFFVAAGSGSSTIADFTPGNGGDILRLQHFGFTSAADVKAHATQVGADTVISLGGQIIKLIGVQLSSLSDGNFALDHVLPTSHSSSNWLSADEGATVHGTAGNDQISTSAEQATLIGGAGDDIYGIGSADISIVERPGEGIDTVQVWTAEGYALPAGQSLENATLMSSFDGWLAGNGLDNVLVGNDARNMILGGGGDDILTGKGGSDLFVVGKGGGSDVVTDFTTGPVDPDAIRLDGFGLDTFDAIKAVMVQLGADTVLQLGGGQTLTLQGVTLGNLTAANFALPASTGSMISTFSDDFTSFSRASGGTGTWQTQYVWGGDGGYTLGHNQEQEVYVDPDFRGLPNSTAPAPLGLDPFTIENGKLVITAAPIDPSISQYTRDLRFTSGVITTESSFWQTYGYFEIKATLPEGKGAWPTFWLLPMDESWPPEMDILEGRGDLVDQIHHAVISGDSDSSSDAWQAVQGLYGQAHTFSALWTPYDITFYVDGVQTARYATPDDMNKPMYMIANLAMGGSWVGSPDDGATARMEIDSIKAYQLPEYTLAGYTLKQGHAATHDIQGTSADETLLGTTGHDLIDGIGGADVMAGGVGDDTYVVRDTRQTISEALGNGIDTVHAFVSFTLSDNVENLVLLGSDPIAGTGNDGANIIVGNAADNVLTGAGGGDVLTGGDGHDTFVFARGDGSDIITDFQTGSGTDDAVELLDFGFSTFADVKDAMSQHGSDVYLRLSSLETLVFRGKQIDAFDADNFHLPDKPPVSNDAIRYVVGSADADTLYGTASRDFLQGKGGNDVLVGGMGDDTYEADPQTTIVEKRGEGIDTVLAWSSVTLSANVENLTLMAAATGTGNALANLITGSSDADIINGKGGNDWLVGGGGADTFVFEKASGRDTIADFQVGTDHLTLSGYGDDYHTVQHDGYLEIDYAGGTDIVRLPGVSANASLDYSIA